MIRNIRIATCWVLAAAAVVAGAATAPAQRHGLDVAGIDKRVAPGDDFFRYANGTWLKSSEIPADRSSYGTGAQLSELTAERTAELIRTAAAGAAAGTEARKIGDYYDSFMDEAAIESKGAGPLQPGLEAIDAIKSRAALARSLGATLRADVDVLNNTNLQTENLFGLWVAQDLDDPARYSPFLLQGGLGMPDRDYYLNPSPKMSDIRARYQAHIAAVLELAHLPDARARAGARVRARAPHGRSAHLARRLRGCAQGRQPLDTEATSRAGRPALTGRRSSPPPDSARSASSSSGSRARSAACRHSPPASRSKCGRTTCAST